MMRGSNGRKYARRGMTAVLAMLYLTLMASLALGFYSATNTAVIVSYNEQKVERARLAAESGLDFARFQLSRVSIPARANKTKHFQLMTDQLAARLNGTGNLSAGNIYADAKMIRVPADPNQYIKGDDQGSEFQFVITDISDPTATPPEWKVRITSVGRNMLRSTSAGIRIMRLDFDLQQNKSKVFQFGLATKGTVVTSGSSRLRGNPDTMGSILTTSPNGTPVSAGGKVISGDISTTNPTANVVVAGGSVGGSSNSTDIQNNHVHKGLEEPEFPTVDTSMFIPYATNVYTPGKGTYSNIRIPPNTNPKFNAGTVLKGVIYIQPPNQVTFNGNASLQGVIVTDSEPVGNLSTNTINFSGSFDAKGVETLDASYGDLRDLAGSFMVLPGFSANFTGNFGAHASGSVLVDKVSLTGSSSLQLDGSLIVMKDTPMTMGGSSELIAGENAFGIPTGLKLTNRYIPVPSSYEELKNRP